MNVLLIDDDLHLGELNKRVLIKQGYQAETFSDAKAAIKHAHQHKPNLILMDIAMPDMPGPEIVKILRDDVLLSYIPVVFVTGLVASTDEELLNEGLNVEGIKYPILAKPYGSEQLLNVVKKYAK